MNFNFTARWSEEDTAWVAGCSVESPKGIIVTEALTEEALRANIDDAVETFLGHSFDRSEHTVTLDFVR